jgi:hypothetical protein
VEPLSTVLCVLKLLKPLVGRNLWPLELSWDMDHALVQSAEDFTGGQRQDADLSSLLCHDENAVVKADVDLEARVSVLNSTGASTVHGETGDLFEDDLAGVTACSGD